MTREIKFKVWDKEAEKFLYLDGIAWYSPSNWREFSDLQQFTGLKDKNGKEIYESDLIRDIDSNAVGRVVYVLSSGLTTAAFTVIFKDNTEWGFVPNSKGQDMHCEVIGNIYSNPELLR